MQCLNPLILYDTFDNKVYPTEQIFRLNNINTEKLNIYMEQTKADGSAYLGDPIVAGDIVDNNVVGNTLLTAGHYILTDDNKTRIYGSSTNGSVESIAASDALDISSSRGARVNIAKTFIVTPFVFGAPANNFQEKLIIN